MTSPDARIDYFRSELLGQIAQVRKEATEAENRLTKRVLELEETVRKQARTIHDLTLR
jgi:hypothetical protein